MILDQILPAKRKEQNNMNGRCMNTTMLKLNYINITTFATPEKGEDKRPKGKKCYKDFEVVAKVDALIFLRCEMIQNTVKTCQVHDLNLHNPLSSP